MNIDADKITINGKAYILEDAISEKAETVEGMEYKIVRTTSAGVFAGYIEKQNGKEVVMRKARRIWYWDGAASLSQLAEEGTSKPNQCKFPCEVDKIELTEAIEILTVSKKAKKSIQGVAIWKQ